MASEIVWPREEDMESTMALVKDKVQDHHSALYGNGKDGILDYIVGQRALMRNLVTLALVFGTLFTAGLFVIAVLEYNRQVQQHLLQPPQIFHSQGQEPVNAKAYRQPEMAD